MTHEMKRLEAQVDTLSSTLKEVNWEDPAIYGAWLAQSYSYVLQSTRILADACARFPLDDQRAHRRFAKHITEEMGHEKLLERDLNALGYSTSDFESGTAIRAFYQVQYYFIEHRTPWAIMGFILALEGAAAKIGGWLSGQVISAHGKPACSFLSVHSQEDEDHFEEANELLQGAPESTLKEIEEAMQVTCYLYESMLRDLPTLAQKAKKKKAA